MKSKEEIEHLAEKYANRFIIDQPFIKDMFVEVYTQCQEDMTNMIKKAIEYGYQLRCNNKPINNGIDWVKEFNSLNK